MSFGAVLIGLNDANERTGTWDADLYLYESWPALKGFTPQTEIVNEVSRTGEDNSLDLTTIANGRCSRTRRLRLTLHTRYNLRRFPFDRQRLELQLSDAQFDSRQVHYSATPLPIGVDDQARNQLSAWSIEDEIAYRVEQRPFRWEAGSPSYDYATFSVHARRHVSYHLTRYFIPLFLLVLISLGVFWVDPEDLNTQVTISVTCLLAVIAQQLAEASSLPDVAYLTLADRLYVVSYFAIATSALVSIRLSLLLRAKKNERALQIQRRCRVVFPVAVVAGTTLATMMSFLTSAT